MKIKILIVIILFVILLVVFHRPLLRGIGEFLIVDDEPGHSDAVVVLFTGVEYFPRLMEAAKLYNMGAADWIVINGNRKTDVLRDLEKKGFERCCPWYEDSVRILSLFDVPREKVIPISAEDVYDTVSEAEAVGKALVDKGFSKVIITTSKSHTRRARFIWETMYNDALTVRARAAASDPFDPAGWWTDGRQIRWVLAEYGAWIFYLWKKIGKEDL
ncbi:MAG: hypothetical protein GY859_44640 [Desulfobacterales bacterium]|nr:hypothetical protein [Desulfobacterales bacterium]